MKRKLITISITILSLIVGMFLIFWLISSNHLSSKDSDGRALTDDELESMQYVDDAIKNLTTTEEYQNMTLDERVLKVDGLLADLKRQNYILNYGYDANEYFFSYEYICGALGGIRLKDFDPMLN